MKKYQLSIEKPCDANLQEMQKTCAGFYCKLCNKDVYDFRTSTKKEINTTLSQSNYNICGIYKTNHIDSFFKLRLPLKFLSLLSLIYSKELFSQENSNTTIPTNTIQNGNIPENRIVMGKIRKVHKENMFYLNVQGYLINNSLENTKDFGKLSLYVYGATQDAHLEKNGKFDTKIEIEKEFTNLYVVITYDKKSISKAVLFDSSKITDNHYNMNIYVTKEDFKQLID